MSQFLDLNFTIYRSFFFKSIISVRKLDHSLYNPPLVRSSLPTCSEVTPKVFNSGRNYLIFYSVEK